jgi:hypothetical protein
MPDTGASRKRQIPGRRNPSRLMTPGLPTVALKCLIEVENRDVALDLSHAPQIRSGFGNAASRISRVRVRSLKNKGFCNPITFRCSARCSAIAAATTFQFAHRLEHHFAAERSVWLLDSVRTEARAMEHRRAGVPKRQSALQMELFEINVMEQRLTIKARSRLRVICATHFQKRLVRYPSERFLCCVCINLR